MYLWSLCARAPLLPPVRVARDGPAVRTHIRRETPTAVRRVESPGRGGGRDLARRGRTGARPCTTSGRGRTCTRCPRGSGGPAARSTGRACPSPWGSAPLSLRGARSSPTPVPSRAELYGIGPRNRPRVEESAAGGPGATKSLLVAEHFRAPPSNARTCVGAPRLRWSVRPSPGAYSDQRPRPTPPGVSALRTRLRSWKTRSSQRR